MGKFLERLVLHATREVSVYLYNFVQGLFDLLFTVTAVLSQNRLDFFIIQYLDYTAW